MNKIHISIIIPVYNVEKYLRQCLDSVVNQTLKEIEIICVNDCSTDSSPKILEEYAGKDERIKIISKEKNEGLGSARKTGLENVNGEFIAFVDSDDWVKLDAFEKLYKNAIDNDSDVIMFNSIHYNEFEDEYEDCWICDIAKRYFDNEVDFNNFTFNYTQIKPHLLNKNFAAWHKIYKTKFIKSYDDFYFPKHIIFEDVPFHVQILLRARKISYCSEKLYFYRTSNIESITNFRGKGKKVLDIFTIVDKVENILIENKKLDEFKNEFSMFKINQLVYWLNHCDESIKKEFFNQTKPYFEKMNLKNGELDDFSLDAQKDYQNSNSIPIHIQNLNYEKKIISK